MRSLYTCYPTEELASWYKPKESDLAESIRSRFREACAALTAVLTGDMGITRAADAHGLCHKRLRAMVKRAPQLAHDGQPYGFRVCVPWGTYQRGEQEGDAEMPRLAGPHAMSQLLSARPEIAIWIDEFGQPLPPGRPPKAFDRLHAKIVAELKRLDLRDFYPLNQADQGRRALLRFIRQRRIDHADVGNLDTGDAPPSTLSGTFRGSPFARTEIDGHRIDIEAVLGVALPNGGSVKRQITSMWLLVEIEVESRVIVGWVLRIGRAYNNLDLASCITKSLQPWKRRELTIPGLEYAPGAGLPSGSLGAHSSWRSRLLALDNAKAHSALDFEQAFCRARGGMLFYGRAHEPRSRPIVEQFFSRLERGALRDVPGGFEPAKRLGESKIRISNFAPNDYPIQLHAFEELLDVIIANYNATPHPALGDLSPLQFLQMQGPKAFAFMPDTAEEDASDMSSVLVPLTVHGNRNEGVMPHVNYMYVRYRSPDLDNKWELVGKTVLARVYRHDLRSFVLMRTATTPLCAVRAAAPWNRTAHDETTRAMIMQWSKLRTGFSITGVDCAIAAYVALLRALAPTSQQAVDQLARMEQVHNGTPPRSRPPAINAPMKIPPGGWISLDDENDF